MWRLLVLAFAAANAALDTAALLPSDIIVGPKATEPAAKPAPAPVLPEQVNSLISPPVVKNDQATAADVSNLFLTSRSDTSNTLMDHIRSVAANARSTGETEHILGLTSPIGLDASAEPNVGIDGQTAVGRSDILSHLDAADALMPQELISPSGQKLSLTSFPQLLAQTAQAEQAAGGANIPQGGVGNVPQGLSTISKEFGSTISSMSAKIGRLFGPSPSYNGPCQCRACMNVVHRLRGVLYDNTYHYGVQEIDQELDDRFCYGERWMYRSTCYHLVGRYREMLKILVWLGTKEFDVCAFLFQCYPTSTV